MITRNVDHSATNNEFNIIEVGSIVDINNNVVRTNIGWDFQTGIFTIQVPGIYVLDFTVITGSASGDDVTTRVKKNGSIIWYSEVDVESSTFNPDTKAHEMLINCDVGDQISVTCESDGNTIFTRIGTTVSLHDLHGISVF